MTTRPLPDAADRDRRRHAATIVVRSAYRPDPHPPSALMDTLGTAVKGALLVAVLALVAVQTAYWFGWLPR
jgi:hypothetical protein